MQFVILCKDKPGSLDLRLSVRPAHVDYLNGLGARLLGAGPFLDDADRPTGSMLMVEVASQAEAEALAADDPYAKAGLFAETQVRRWRWSIKPPQAA